jgi:hypothetical protein
LSSPAQRANARRQQSWRKRQRQGQIVLPISVPEEEVAEALIATRRLTEPEALDRKKLARAVAEIVTEWVRQWGPKIP